VRIGGPGTTLLAALFSHKGLPLSAALVFTGLGAYFEGGSRWPTSWRAAALLFLLLVAVGSEPLLEVVGSPSLHRLAAVRHGWPEWLAASAIALWSLGQLVSSGPRAWFASLRSGAFVPAASPHKTVDATAQSL